MKEQLPVVAAVNKALSSAWNGGRWRPPSLNPDAIEAYVCRKEGLRSVPGAHWRDAYRVLLSELERSADLNPLGRVIANGQIVSLLRARTRAARLLKAHPEIRDWPVQSPIIIVGQMRSGTTRLHRLLACDPKLAHTRLFETLDPVPYGRWFDRRLPLGAAVSAFLRAANPATQQVHPTGPLRPEEEFGFNSFSFHGAQFEVQWNVPEFARWCEQRDTRAAYMELRSLVQIGSWARRQKPGMTWLMKCPQFTADLESLLSVFPDARFLFLHRDHGAIAGSSASLVSQQRRIHSDHVDAQAIGAEWLRKTALRERRIIRFRRENRSVPQLDLEFDEVSRDWLGQVGRIYAFLGRELEEEVIRRMQRYASRAAAHRGHAYSLEQFGLDQGMVDAAMRQSFEPRVAEPA